MKNDWFVGSNGNYFRDMGGFRYCVYAQTTYVVARDGVVLSEDSRSITEAKVVAEVDAKARVQP